MDNCAIYILNALNEVLDRGEIGQIFVAGAHLADGYIHGKEMATNFIHNAIDERKVSFSITYYSLTYSTIHI